MAFKFSISEHNIGVADETRLVTVKALNIKSALKKLRRYLENQYEDSISYSPHFQQTSGIPTHNPGCLKAHFRRNAGHLVIMRLPQ